MLRIAFVTPEYVTETNFDGGLANYLHRVSLALVAFGHEPVIIVSSNSDQTLFDRGIEVQRVNIARGAFRHILSLRPRRIAAALYLIAQSWQLNQRLERLHLSKPLSLVQYTHLGAVGLFRSRQLPAMARLSSYTPLVKQAYGLSPGFMGGAQHILEMAALRRMDAVFSPSRLIADAVKQETNLDVRVIETPFLMDCREADNSIFTERLHGKRYLLFFGTLGQLKGVPVIADILAELLGRHPQLYFVFVGKEDPNHSAEPMMARVWAKAGAYCDRALYLGQLRHEQLYPIIENAYAVILPSRIDNFPNTAIEAMAFGRVVVGTRGTSFEQLLTDGTTGFLCDPDSPASLLAVTEKVLQLSADERMEIGRNAQTRILELRPEKVVRQLLGFYSEVMAKAGGSNHTAFVDEEGNQ